MTKNSDCINEILNFPIMEGNPMRVCKITSKGQTTIPKHIRDRIGLRAGDHVYFFINGDGDIVIRPRSGSAKSLYGMLKRPEKSLSIEEMDEAVGKAIADRSELSP